MSGKTDDKKAFVSREEGAKLRAKKKADDKTGAAAGNEHIQDIPHEVVPNNNGAKPESLITGDDDAIKKELVKFNYTDAKIQELKDQFGPLVISGPTDKAGYEAVKKAWGMVRGVRTSFEKKGLELRNQFKKVLTAISGEEDRLITLVTPLEDELYKKWKDVDDEKERVKKEQEEAEQKRLMTRLEELVGLGMRLENGFYQLGETISMDAATLRALPDEQYEKLKQTVQMKALQIAEDLRLKEEKDEADRLELKKKEDALKADQEKLKKEQDELRAQRREVRVGKLENLGMKLTGEDPDVIAYDHVRLYVAPLLDMTGDEFNKVVEATTAKIKDVKDDTAKKDQLKEDTRVRTLAMEALDFDLERGAFVYDDDYHDPLRLDAQQIFTMDPSGWGDHLKQMGIKILDYKNAKVKHEQEVAEETRLKEIKEKFIAQAMDIAGLGYRYATKDFYFKNEVKEIVLTWKDLLPLPESEITTKASGLADEVRAAKKLADEKEADRKKEKKRLEELALDDKGRFAAMLDAYQQFVEGVETVYKTQAFSNRAKMLRMNILELIKENR